MLGKLAAAAVATFALASAPAHAADRYASPSGTSADSCAKADPCDVYTAIHDAPANSDVFIPAGAGDYTLDKGVSDANPPVHVHGTGGRPRLVFSSSGLTLGSGSTAEHLYVEVGAGGELQLLTAAADDVIAVQTGDGHACHLVSGGVLTNSVCWGRGDALSPLLGNPPQSVVEADDDATLRNDTLSAAGGSGDWDGLLARSADAGGPWHVTLVNVIARGAGAGNDVQADSDGSATVDVTTSHSNYATTAESGPAGDASIVDDGTSQVAAPVFADALGGDFHQATSSPTIDAGANDPQNGASDFDGQPRTIDGTTDIGADEAVLAPKAVTGRARPRAVRATVHGKVNPNGLPTSYRFDFGTTRAYGRQSATKSLKAGATARAVHADLEDLRPNTTYHYRLVASNAVGDGSGRDRSFTTFGGVRIESRRATVKKRTAKVKLVCPARAAGRTKTTHGPCDGRLTLRAVTQGRVVVVGAGSFTIPAGEKVAVPLTIRKGGMRMLRKSTPLNTLAVARAHDGRGTTATTTRNVELERGSGTGAAR